MSNNNSGNNAAQNARRSLADLKKQLENAQPVYVDSQGRLTTPEEEALREKSQPVTAPPVASSPNNAPPAAAPAPQTPRTTVKPSRWF